MWSLIKIALRAVKRIFTTWISGEAIYQYQQAQEDLNLRLKWWTKMMPKCAKWHGSKAAKAQIETLETDLQILLLPRDPNDDSNCFVEIRAGAGGDEAAIFAGDLFRMYSRYAETQGWRVEVMNANEGEHGGFKEVIANVSVMVRMVFSIWIRWSPSSVYQKLNSSRSTSACTVAVLPGTRIASYRKNPADLRIDTRHQVRVDSTLTKRIRRSGLPIFQPALWLNVRTNVHNTKTAKPVSA